jgi:hypothetical protein
MGIIMAASTQAKKSSAKFIRETRFSLISLGVVGPLAWAVENQFFNTFLYEIITSDPRPLSRRVAGNAAAATPADILIGRRVTDCVTAIDENRSF